jgi:glycosyltransferase involved in cell wall biosynthesis
VEALEPDARLVVVGDGPERQALAALASDLGLTRVRFAGYVGENDMAQYYAASDLVAHVARQETFGLTIVEAAAFGVPSLVVDEGGPRYTVIDGETGVRVAATEDAVTEGLTRLLVDAATLRRMGARARSEIAPRYTWERGAEDFLRVCRSLDLSPRS